MKLAPFQERILRDIQGTGYGLWAGVELLEIAPSASRMTFKIREEMLTPWGTLNGGVINSLVEIPSFVALLTALEEDEHAVTNDIFLQHVRPLPGDVPYELCGALLRRGRTVAWTDVVVRAGGKEVSHVRITKTILKR
jgi:uncharacterized protein (TIGR00369 family)